MAQPVIQSSSIAGDACPLPSKSSTTNPNSAPIAVKPCCVCKDEKAQRDECMLFSARGEEDCKPMIAAYRSCMAGYGFKLP